MSNGEKKPGMRDISDLKARLGMLNKNIGGKPEATPAPAAQNPFGAGGEVDLTTDPEAELGMDTAVVRIERSPEVAAPEPPATPAPSAVPVASRGTLRGPPAPAPAAPPPAGGFSPFGIGDANELFREPEPEPPPPPPQSAPLGAPQMPAEPTAPPPEAGFAHPLHVGRFHQAAEPVNLSADEEAVLASFEAGQRGVSKTWVLFVALAVAAVVGLLAFVAGDSRRTRLQINSQIDEAAKVQKLVDSLLDHVDTLLPLVQVLDPKKVDFSAVDLLPEELPGVDAGAILSVNTPLPADLMRLLGNSLADMDGLFRATLEHRQSTLVRDRAELEALSEGVSWFAEHESLAILFDPVDPKIPAVEYVPPQGTVVALVGRPEKNEKGDDRLIAIKFRSGNEKQVSLRRLLAIKKGELFDSGKSNALTLYEKRVTALRERVRRINDYKQTLRGRLAEEANRGKVLAF